MEIGGRFKMAFHNARNALLLFFSFFPAIHSTFSPGELSAQQFRGRYRQRERKMTDDLTFIAAYVDGKLFSASTCLRRLIIFRVLFPRGNFDCSESGQCKNRYTCAETQSFLGPRPPYSRITLKQNSAIRY